MQSTDTFWILPFALALCVPAVFAQGADAAKSVPQAAVTTTTPEFNSTFTGYRAYTEQPVGSWRDANDEVGRIGGWRAYAREAAATDGAKGGVSPAPTSTHDHGKGGKP